MPNSGWMPKETVPCKAIPVELPITGKGSIVDFLLTAKLRRTPSCATTAARGRATALVTDGPDAQGMSSPSSKSSGGRLVWRGDASGASCSSIRLCYGGGGARTCSLGIDACSPHRPSIAVHHHAPSSGQANRLSRAGAQPARHGSCGMGIGETAADALALGEQRCAPATWRGRMCWSPKLRLRARSTVPRTTPPLRFTGTMLRSQRVGNLTDADWLGG